MVVKVVIGLNYGDEGKGLMTDYLSHEAVSKGHSVLNVMTNGSAQRGHTVELKDGTRHVFHHFGSGTFAGADTYCPKQFMINPIVFNEEHEKLKYDKQCIVHCKCPVVTPYHMMAGQVREYHKRNGSCGMGAWETVLYPYLTVEDLTMTTVPHIIDKIEGIRSTLGYMFSKNDIYWDDRVLYAFVYDCIKFVDKIETTFHDRIVLEDYDTVIFENGQGLLLDQKLPDKDHLTPSNTDLTNIKDILKLVEPDEIETIYVTRSYITRHGNGPFPEECKKEDINSNIIDPTNVYNKWQGNLRYGKLDLNESVKRIEKFGKTSLAITHLNEYQIDVPDINVGKIYWSDGITRESIKVSR